MKNEVLRIDSGQVKINGNTMLDNLYIQVYAGETLGIIFDDIHEKYALIQLLSGEEKLSRGRFYLNEVMLNIKDVAKLIKNYIFIISESPVLIPTLNIVENIYLSQCKFMYINNKSFNKKADKLFKYYNIHIPLNKPVKHLTNMERVTIELLKAVSLGCKLIVLSHLTSILSKSELSDFFSLVSQLRESGIAFIVIETFQDIIFEQTNNLSIIKNGATIGVFDSSQLDREKIYNVIYHEPKSNNNDTTLVKINQCINTKEVVMKFENVSSKKLDKINFDIRRGEILKIICTDNISADNLIGILKGNYRPSEGRILVNKHPYVITSISEAQKNGVCFVEENPTETMLFKKHSVMYNLCIPLCNKVPLFWFRQKYINSVEKSLKDLINPHYFNMPILNLPTNVLQTIVYYRWLLYSPKVVVCIKPFLIADMQINRATEQMINLLANKGIAILIITSNWPSLNSLKGNTLYLENGNLFTT